MTGQEYIDFFDWRIKINEITSSRLRAEIEKFKQDKRDSVEISEIEFLSKSDEDVKKLNLPYISTYGHAHFVDDYKLREKDYHDYLNKLSELNKNLIFKSNICFKDKKLLLEQEANAKLEALTIPNWQTIKEIRSQLDAGLALKDKVFEKITKATSINDSKHIMIAELENVYAQLSAQNGIISNLKQLKSIYENIKASEVRIAEKTKVAKKIFVESGYLTDGKAIKYNKDETFTKILKENCKKVKDEYLWCLKAYGSEDAEKFARLELIKLNKALQEECAKYNNYVSSFNIDLSHFLEDYSDFMHDFTNKTEVCLKAFDNIFEKINDENASEKDGFITLLNELPEYYKNNIEFEFERVKLEYKTGVFTGIRDYDYSVGIQNEWAEKSLRDELGW